MPGMVLSRLLTKSVCIIDSGWFCVDAAGTISSCSLPSVVMMSCPRSRIFFQPIFQYGMITGSRAPDKPVGFRNKSQPNVLKYLFYTIWPLRKLCILWFSDFWRFGGTTEPVALPDFSGGMEGSFPWRRNRGLQKQRDRVLEDPISLWQGKILEALPTCQSLNPNGPTQKWKYKEGVF